MFVKLLLGIGMNAYGKKTAILGSYVIRESMIKDYILT